MKQFSGKVMLIYEINKTIFDVVSRCVFSVVLSERSMAQSHLEMNKFALLTKLGVTVFYCYYYCRCKLRLFFHPFLHLVVRGFISLFISFVRSCVRCKTSKNVILFDWRAVMREWMGQALLQVRSCVTR